LATFAIRDIAATILRSSSGVCMSFRSALSAIFFSVSGKS
jgi:hypothetical protein